MRRRTVVAAPVAAAERWWPLVDVARTGSRWFDEHVQAGWWDPGDPVRTRLRHAAALVDELLASLPQGTVADGRTVIELGAGPGAALQELAVRTPCTLHAWSADAQDAAVARALTPEATVHDGDLPLPPADGSVDVVWVPRELFRGTTAWATLVAEAHRLLRPGGFLAAVVAGPGAWAWEERPDPWDEDGTGLLVLGLDRPDAEGGPTAFSSRWWRQEHWGRGFRAAGLRPSGALMVHPGQGLGLDVWQREAGAPVTADAFAAVRADEAREGPAFRRQLALAAVLERPDAVDEDPRLREPVARVRALEAELARLRDDAPATAAG